LAGEHLCFHCGPSIQTSIKIEGCINNLYLISYPIEVLHLVECLSINMHDKAKADVAVVIILRWFTFQLHIHTPQFLDTTFISLINLILESFQKRSAVVAGTIFEWLIENDENFKLTEKGLLKNLYAKLTEVFDREDDETFVELVVVFCGDMSKGLKKEEAEKVSEMVKKAAKKPIENPSKISIMKVRKILDRKELLYFLTDANLWELNEICEAKLMRGKCESDEEFIELLLLHSAVLKWIASRVKNGKMKIVSENLAIKVLETYTLILKLAEKFGNNGKSGDGIPDLVGALLAVFFELCYAYHPKSSILSGNDVFKFCSEDSSGAISSMVVLFEKYISQMKTGKFLCVFLIYFY
jgi:hypothetical protein